MIGSELVLGEYKRTVDERFRLSLPAELLEGLQLEQGQAVLVKETPGCASLWHRAAWTQQLESSVRIVESKLREDRMRSQTDDLQRLGRLLSTRHRDVAVAGRGRMLVPEGYREFLGIEPGSDVMVVGAAVCIEIWRISAWNSCLDEQIPQFSALLSRLSD